MKVKPTELMRQMKALLPTDDRPGTYFMASFLLLLPSDMRDHLIAKDFTDGGVRRLAVQQQGRQHNRCCQHRTRGGRQRRLRRQPLGVLAPRPAAGAPLAEPPGAPPPNSNTLQITTQAVGDASPRDVSTGVFRPLVPIKYREAVFQLLHSIHHPGVWFCRPQMAKAITLMARTCLFCQRGKVHKHVHLQPAEIPVPHRRFTHIHVDLVGPLPPSRGHT
jgi:hypothetical protein